MAKRNGAGEYIKDMKKMKFKYEIDKAFSLGDDVCIIYEIDMSGKAKIPASGLYHLDDGKISSLKVFFNPRPILNDKKLENRTEKQNYGNRKKQHC